MLGQLLLSIQWHELLQPQFYIEHGGLWVLLFVVFAETGLFIGFFLPGDSLLFVAGIYAHMGSTRMGKGLSYQFLELIGADHINNDKVSLAVLILLVTIAGILGNTVGYIIGKRLGVRMYHWKDNLLFKQHYLQQAHDFYQKHGGFAIVMARFVPIIRTFAPIVAGIVKMDRKVFQLFNWIGCLAWTMLMISAGHYLDRIFLEHFNLDLKKHLEIIVLAIVLITTLPVILKLVLKKKK